MDWKGLAPTGQLLRGSCGSGVRSEAPVRGSEDSLMPDQLSALYSEFLEGGYDCVDRVILNAYFSMGQSGGGFRTWWRELYGSDEDLDDNHLMRMAGRFSRRLCAWAKANHVPVVYCSAGERTHEIAEQHLSTKRVKPGLS